VALLEEEEIDEAAADRHLARPLHPDLAGIAGVHQLLDQAGKGVLHAAFESDGRAGDAGGIGHLLQQGGDGGDDESGLLAQESSQGAEALAHDRAQGTDLVPHLFAVRREEGQRVGGEQLGQIVVELLGFFRTGKEAEAGGVSALQQPLCNKRTRRALAAVQNDAFASGQRFFEPGYGLVAGEDLSDGFENGHSQDFN